MIQRAFSVPLAAVFLITVSAAGAGDLEAGISAYENQEFDKAFAYLHPLAEQGNGRAQLYVARLFEAEKAPAKALTEGGPYRYSRPAVAWYRKAADNGNAKAMNALAVHHGRGWKHLEKDPQRALELLEKASEAGHGKASYNLYALTRNRGAEAESHRWLERAAQQGMAKAQNRLGMLYATGREGVDQDFGRAEKWLSRAAEQGHQPAKATLPTVKRQLGARSGDD
jgi:hypothetical protein